MSKKKLKFSMINGILRNDMNAFLKLIETEKVSAFEMYQDIFNNGEDLEEKGEYKKGGESRTCKYNLIAIQIINKENDKRIINRVAIHKGLNELKKIIEEKEKKFNILSCISYAGNNNTMINARYMYALVIDLDDIREGKSYDDNGIISLVDFYMYQKRCPIPNYIVSSGHGLHLYFVFNKPIPLYKNIQEKIFDLKKEMIKRIWTEDVSNIEPQYGSVVQGFRMGGTYTKASINSKKTERTQCFKIITAPHKYTLYDLAETTLMSDEEKEKYKSIDSNLSNRKYTIEEAKRKFPEWYQKRVIEKRPRGKWNIKKDLYEWWIRTIKTENKEHHRYFCCMFACIYAIKCNVPLEKVKSDLYELLPYFNSAEREPFTKQDIDDSLFAFQDNYYFWTRDKISLMSAIPIKANKRNGMPQKEHIEFMNFRRKQKINLGICKVGRKKGQIDNEKEKRVIDYLKNGGDKRVKEIMKNCNISSEHTAIKYKKIYESMI